MIKDIPRQTSFKNHIIFTDQGMNITFSIGMAIKDQNPQETLIARVKQAMYIVKHKGRNRVAVSK